jgi:hypothetical protein
MLIKTCFQCKSHEVRQNEEERMSYCRKENCWSIYSHCMSKKALDRFLAEECVCSEAYSSMSPGG